MDFRHQIYTENVNLAPFVDGDKNIVILDRDASLSGYVVVDKDTKQIVEDIYPISLNNLAFNGTPYTVNECLSEGSQDTIAENRPT